MSKPPETQEGLFARIGVLLASIIGAYSVLGAPIMILVPIILFVIAWIFGAWEISIQARTRHWRKLHWLCQLGGVALLASCVYSSYQIFVVKMDIQFATGYPMVYRDGTSVEQMRFAVQLVNSGKPTSLISWKAYMTAADGRTFPGEILNLNTADGVEIVGTSGNKTTYAIPECDLAFETTRAMQTGDSVFGVISFAFPGLSPGPVPLNTKVVLQATDVLGRTIKSKEQTFADVNNHPPTLFPCSVRLPKQP